MPHRILVVDDVPDACEVLARLLRVCGFDVATALNGADAFVMLDGFAPDVVILDLNMPVMDGYGFLEAVRKLPSWNRVRVIVFTADHHYDAARLNRLGVVKICRKAYTPFQTLMEQVSSCLSPA
jgi:two-component system, chemotaxis family, chemotaxis protein CheY